MYGASSIDFTNGKVTGWSEIDVKLKTATPWAGP
jgi:hypothetical protein